MDTKIRTGFRVVGNTALTGQLHVWYFLTLDEANHFARQLCEDTREEVDVMKYVGSWKVSSLPVEFIESKDKDVS